jgi:GTP cyclohydrolase II
MENIKITAEAKLPTLYGEYRIFVFQEQNTQIEHIALRMGSIRNKADIITRVHSECITGDIFSSLKCDCGQQLNESLKLVHKHGEGLVIYLRNHEGRGIGLVNKIKAYNLQEKGYDTINANLALGLPVDNRSYLTAATIIKHFSPDSIKLITNNPDKLLQLQQYGVKVAERVSLNIAAQEHNKDYLLTKQQQMGHIF